MIATTDLVQVQKTGIPRLHFHSGQYRAWQSEKRFIFLLAGTQSGKTAFEPWWLSREIDTCGGGDYLAVTATYDLFQLKFLPAMREVFEHKLRRARYWAANRTLEIADPDTGKFIANRADDPMWARIILRSADAEGGLESNTAKAAVLDECGMDNYKLHTWEAVLRRLSLNQGRVLGGTTIYNFNDWLQQAIYHPWLASKGKHPLIDIVQFDSTTNPSFPREEYERARDSMPAWKFNMFYRGQYERPAGLIYDCFDSDRHVVPAFSIHPEWNRFLGLDFGGINTAAVSLAAEPNSERYFLYREYHAGNRTAAQHATAILAGEPGIPTVVGGSKSEGQWRREFQVAGLPVREPRVSDVEVGIQRVYGLIKQNRLFVFDTCRGVIDDLQAYSRKLDSMGEATEEIADKATWHRMDALRYIATRIADTKRVGRVL